MACIWQKSMQLCIGYALGAVHGKYQTKCMMVLLMSSLHVSALSRKVTLFTHDMSDKGPT